MRGQWNLRDWEVDYWRAFFERKIVELKSGYVREIDLTQEDLCPENVIDTLIALGYEDDEFESNGWEQDTDIFFIKENDVGLVLQYCGRTFRMVLFLNDEEV